MQAIYREEDRELLGYIAEITDSKSLWVPLTIFYYELTPPSSQSEAETFIKNRGLEVLSEPWWFYSQQDDEWYKCDIAEAHADKVRVCISDYGHPDVHSYMEINNPTTRTLRLKRPRST